MRKTDPHTKPVTMLRWHYSFSRTWWLLETLRANLCPLVVVVFPSLAFASPIFTRFPTAQERRCRALAKLLTVLVVSANRRRRCLRAFHAHPSFPRIFPIRFVKETERNDRNCKLHEFCNLKIIFPEVRSSSLQIRRSNILFDRVTLKIFQKFNPGNLNFLSDTRFFEIASRRNFHLVRTFLSIQNSTMNETHMIDRSCQLFANFCTTIFHNSCSPQLWEESLYLGPRCERVMNGIQLGRG